MSMLPFRGICWHCGHDHDKHQEIFETLLQPSSKITTADTKEEDAKILEALEIGSACAAGLSNQNDLDQIDSAIEILNKRLGE